jgi:uncharacterized protein (DUF1501 family)
MNRRTLLTQSTALGLSAALSALPKPKSVNGKDDRLP